MTEVNRRQSRLYRSLVLPELNKPNAARHGTRAMYVRGCKCDDCTDAEALYSREYKRRRREANGHR